LVCSSCHTVTETQLEIMSLWKQVQTTRQQQSSHNRQIMAAEDLDRYLPAIESGVRLALISFLEAKCQDKTSPHPFHFEETSSLLQFLLKFADDKVMTTNVFTSFRSNPVCFRKKAAASWSSTIDVSIVPQVFCEQRWRPQYFS
jgi:hypothetical protein